MENDNTHSIYGDSRILLEETLKELELRAGIIAREQKTVLGRKSVEYIKTRIKTEESMREKLRRKGLPLTPQAALCQVHDAVGMRIICPFADDVYRMAVSLAEQKDFIVIKEKDFIENPKPNGYRSYHLIIMLPVRLAGREENIYAEIQLRTIAMDCWASLEHQLKYKKEVKNQELIVAELKRCSDEIASTDLTMQTIRELIEEVV